MAKAHLWFLPLVLSVLYGAGAAEVSTSYIRASCKATEFPSVCVESLSGYAATIQQNPKQLCETALAVSLARAEAMRAFVTKMKKLKGLKPRENEAIEDCLDEIGDSVDRIGKSMREIKAMGKGKGKEFLWHVSNVQTWVSAALTDENTCLDGFAGRAMNQRIKASVRARVNDVAQVTSNALALVNQFASNH
ncbi:21 kDa protein-like [Diospyros lotus]|uniref:21 kDa protein-like n=1 Tax=Diospyros lotus TaxID=55363 RepID=UPI002257764E|nr:21 kDa protein-like [Diospyros lotus]